MSISDSNQKLSHRFIYLIGVEGTGKTTQANLLTKWLESRGETVNRVNIRTGHLLIHLLRNLTGYPTQASKAGSWKADQFSERIKNLWPLLFFLEIVNTIILAFFRVFLPLKLNRVVIAEGYVIDTYCDLRRRYKKYSKENHFYQNMSKILLRFIPSSTIIVNLDVGSYNELIRRYKKRKGSSEPQDYVNFRRRQILQYAPLFDNYFYINTKNGDEFSTLQKIVKMALKS